VNHSFNLVDEPFIPCVMVDGSALELNLRETLRRASDIREITDSSPLTTVALHRLLLALLHHVFGPENPRQWKHLWQAGHWDADRLDKYWKDWRGRFDLFDSKHPFYQTAGYTTKEPSSVSRLAQELASGNNPTLFDHTVDSVPPRLSAAAAARLVITQQVWAIGGGRSDTGYTSHAPLVQGAVIFPQGRSLFETLMLNLIAYNSESPMPASKDAPVWERETRPPTNGSSVPTGYLDYLTWQGRTLTLHAESENGCAVVRMVSFAQGRRLDPSVIDPMMAYVKTKQGGWRPLRLSEYRELWRDSGALFQIADGPARRPATFNWLARLTSEGLLEGDRRYNFAVFGLCSDQAKVSFWRYDRMPLPLPLLNDVVLVEALQQGLKLTEDVAYTLRSAIEQLAQQVLSPGDQRPDPNRVRELVKCLAPERPYWSRLELPFRRFVVALAESGGDTSPVVADWVTRELPTEARAAFERTVVSFDTTARWLRAVTKARQQFTRKMAIVTKQFREVVHESS
jgi:CRISPR system Cascade subunit CasA